MFRDEPGIPAVRVLSSVECGPAAKAASFSPTLPALQIAGMLWYRFYSSALLHSFPVYFSFFVPQIGNI